MHHFLSSQGSFPLFLVLAICAVLPPGFHATGENHATRPRVCIVGSGIAGATTAYHVHLSCGKILDMTVFERDGHVGGRIATLRIPGTPPTEAGASILASGNRLMESYINTFNLSIEAPHGDAIMGLWNGSAFVMRTSPSSARTVATVGARYGLSVIRSRRFVSRLIGLFNRLYAVPDHSPDSYLSVPAFFARASELYDMTQMSFRTITDRMFNRLYTDEMIAAITRVNYGQEIDAMNGFSGAVALAGSGNSLFRVHGGNVQVVENLLRASGALVRLNTSVSGIQRNGGSDSAFSVRTAEGEEVTCNAVVMAAPVELANVSLPPDVDSSLRVGREFQLTVATFVKGWLNTATFGADPPDNILTTGGVNDSFTAIGKTQMSSDPPVFKLFSRNLLTESDLSRLFENGSSVVSVFPWRAYPVFSPPERFAPFAVGGVSKGFFYTSGIESAASAMEMCAMAGFNVAALVRDRFKCMPERSTIENVASDEL